MAPELVVGIIIFVFSFILILKSSDLFTDGAAKLAKSLGVSDFIIGITVVAFGTSLPELFVSVTAARKGFMTMVLGNIIVSNIANILWVFGVAAIIRPVMIRPGMIVFQVFFMFLLSFLLVVFKKPGYTIARKEGAFFILVYIAFVFVSLVYGNNQMII